MRVSAIAVTASLLAATQACYDDSYLFRRSADAPSGNSTQSVNGTSGANHFSYDGFEGPLGWHLIDPANSLCAVGKQQTPINLNDKTTTEEGKEFEMNIPKANGKEHVQFENKGHTVEVNKIQNGTLKFGNGTYDLVQAHFHTPSEHRINDEFSPMELHFVHKSTGILPLSIYILYTCWQKIPEGKFAVVGFVIEIGRITTPALNSILRQAHKIKASGEKTDIPNLDFSSIIESLSKNRVYRYQGSLTTPPCTEGLEWIVSEKALTIDWMTFNSLKKILKFNSRYTQSQPGQENLLAHSMDGAKKAMESASTR